MSYEVLAVLCSCLFGSWMVLVIRTIRQSRRVNSLEATLRLKELEPDNTFAARLSEIGRTAAIASSAMSSLNTHHCDGCRCYEKMKPSLKWYDPPDKDGDGVPDAFQRRKPLSEILEFDRQPAEPGEPMTPGRISSNPNEYWIAIELPPRHPRKHEYFILNGEIIQSTQNYTNLFQAIIIKQTRGCRPEDLVELSK